MKIAIVNCGMGNLRSVANAFEAIGSAPRVCDRPQDIRHAERIVLPGVGAFADGMRRLEAGGWIEPLEEEVLGRRKPFLGICLGLQLLATESEEHGLHRGLGWIPGRVRRLPETTPPLRIPHVGWNDVAFRGGRLHAGIGDAGVFYFVHSYYLEPEDPDPTTGTCTYGASFCASLERENVFATQYHPEKSQRHGAAVLMNFLDT